MDSLAHSLYPPRQLILVQSALLIFAGGQHCLLLSTDTFKQEGSGRTPSPASILRAGRVFGASFSLS